jgi:hypothetical protein
VRREIRSNSNCWHSLPLACALNHHLFCGRWEIS